MHSSAVAAIGQPVLGVCAANRLCGASGVRSLLRCHYEMIIKADHWLNDIPLASFGPKMVCTKCRTVGADVRPNWRERGT